MKKILLLSIAPLLFSFTQASKTEISSPKKTTGFSLHTPLFENSLKSFPLPEPISKVKFDYKADPEWKQKDGIVTYSPNFKASWSWGPDGKIEDKTEKNDSKWHKDWPPSRD